MNASLSDNCSYNAAGTIPFDAERVGLPDNIIICKKSEQISLQKN